MTRFLILLTGLFAAFALAAATASADKPAYNWDFQATPDTLVVGNETALSGTLTTGTGLHPVVGASIAINVYTDKACSLHPFFVGTFTTGHDGSYSYVDKNEKATFTMYHVGTFYFQASLVSEKTGDVGIASHDAAPVVSACVPVTVTEAPAPATEPATEPLLPSDTVASSFLCWNHDMVDPVAYTDKVADEMWTTGNYFEPQAILGNVEGGTNVGAYHLVCNAPSTMQPSGSGVGGSGEVYSPDLMLAYHQAHAGANDLNVYHVFK
jgi:hypothetical protein